MTYACLGWGSLIWQPRDFAVREADWLTDGPILPLEFARLSGRKSSLERLTLVIVEGGTELQTLWGRISAPSLDDAVEQLRQREGIGSKSADLTVGRWPNSMPKPFLFQDRIAAWAQERKLDGVVWTALPANMGDGEGALPSLDSLIDYLRSRDANALSPVLEYLERGPPQIRTNYREALTAAARGRTL